MKGKKAVFNTQPSALPVTGKAALSAVSSIVLGLFSSRDNCSPYTRKIKGRFMRGFAYGASLSNLVSITPGDRRQLHERAQSLQGFCRGDSEQGTPYKGSGDSSPEPMLLFLQEVLIQNLPGVTCTSRAHDLCFPSRIERTEPLP